jgi:hypothetical protein
LNVHEPTFLRGSGGTGKGLYTEDPFDKFHCGTQWKL